MNQNNEQPKTLQDALVRIAELENAITAYREEIRNISCALEAGDQEDIGTQARIAELEAWGKEAWLLVTQLSPRVDRAFERSVVRDGRALGLVPDESEGYRAARGIVHVDSGNPSPEDIIRKMRDGEEERTHE